MALLPGAPNTRSYSVLKLELESTPQLCSALQNSVFVLRRKLGGAINPTSPPPLHCADTSECEVSERAN
jgi:hypothetical protein